MNKQLHRRLHRLDWPLVLISVLVLLVCLFYTYAHVFLAPHPGITINSEWIVTAIDPCDAYAGWCEANRDGLQVLQVGDQLIAIGDLTYQDYWDGRRRVRFGGYSPGEAVPITSSRDGDRQTIHWQMPVVTGANRARQLLGLLPYLPFWLAGTAVLLFLRPRDGRWRLLVSFNYLTALWLAAGIVSSRRVAASSLVLHAVTWLMAPVYLHLHLTVPTRLLRQRSRYFLPPLYAIAAILATLELFQLLPASAYALGLLLAIPGSLGLLLFRLFDRSSPAVRLAARLMLAGIGLAFGPGIALWLIPKLLNAPAPGELATNFALLALPALPLFYTYAIYKRRLGPLEFRANRLLSLYSFILLYGTAFVLVFSIGSQWLNSPDSSVVFSLIVSIVFVSAALPLRPRFQRLIDRLAYGTEHNPDDIVRVFANRIPAALDREALVPLLADQVAPSLLIRQSALVLLANGDTSLVYARGVSLRETPETPQQVQRLLAKAGRYRPPLAEAQDEYPDGHRLDWVRLAVPLEIRKKTIGVWLFGRRAPDDYYPQHDIALLTALASQVAVAVENARLYQEVQRELAERKRAEEELIRLSSAVKTSIDGIVIMDIEGKVTDVNEAVLKLYGTEDKGDLTGQHVLDLIAPEHREKGLAGIGFVLERGYDKSQDYEIVAKDGRRIPAELSAAVMKDADGKPTGIVSIVRDITERKRMEEELRKAHDELETRVQERTADLAKANEALQTEITERKRAEEALRESEERHRLLVENANEIIIVAQDGMLRFVNPKATELTGYTEDELTSMPFVELVHPDDREMAVEHYLKCLQGEETPQSYAVRIIDKDGNIKWMESNAVLILWDGRPATLNFITDITERKRAEEALRESQQQYRVLVETMQDGVAVQDGSAILTFVNDRFCEIMGYSRDELLGHTAMNFLDESGRSIVGEQMEMRRKGEEDPYELEVVRKDGQRVSILISPKGLLDTEGNIAGSFGVVTDITERKRAEEALRASEERYRAVSELTSDFAYSIVVGPDGKFELEWITKAFTHITGFTPDEARAHGGWMGMIHPDDLSNGSQRFQNLLRDQTDVREFRIVTKSGELRCLRVHGYPVWDDAQGRTVRIYGAAQDITERKRAEEEIRRHNRELSAINAIAATVNQSLDLGEVLDRALDNVLEMMELDVGAIRLLDEQDGTLGLNANRGIDLSSQVVERISRFKLAESPLAKVIATGEPLIIEDISNIPIVELMGRGDFKSLAVIPLKSKGRVLGIMEVVSLDSRQFTSEEIRLLSSIGNQIGVAIQNAQLWHETDRRLQESTILLRTRRDFQKFLGYN